MAGPTATMASMSTSVSGRSAPDLVAKAIKPDYAIGSHVAPLGLLFYTGSNLPAQYRGGAFIGEHGSWDRSPLSGYVVAYVAFENGKPVGAPKPVVTGFASDDEKELRGAPGRASPGSGRRASSSPTMLAIPSGVSQSQAARREAHQV